MLDALQEDLESLVAMKPLLGLEVGYGPVFRGDLCVAGLGVAV